jgi:hypothetical protein
MKMLRAFAFSLLGLASVGCGGSGDSASNPTNAVSFCKAKADVDCDKVFECTPTAQRDQDFVSLFGSSAAECKSMFEAKCATAASDCPTFVASQAAMCISSTPSQTCDQFNGTGDAPGCDAACP